ncbi:hypothetical protein LIER_18279 [Lithospermum erythrorhizon]|uniref:C3H1-type domain-containing protein n=1 Tax=Lithospermum erythrorhizon TaxID=34254 RepID=A0AAV3QDD9_LITER
MSSSNHQSRPGPSHKAEIPQPEPSLHRALDPMMIDYNETMMNVYKIKRCPNEEPHDLARCLYTHIGDIYRRDHSLYYPEYCTSKLNHNSVCIMGDRCRFAHGPYEYFYHPGRYRTEYCNFGVDCNTIGCPFVHNSSQFRRPHVPIMCDRNPPSWRGAVPKLLLPPHNGEEVSPPLVKQ